MTADKKNKYLQWIQTIGIVLSFLVLVFGGYKGAVSWGEWKAEMKAEMKERMFKNSEERVKTQQMVARPYSEYKNMQKADSLLMQQKDLDAAFDTINRRYINDEEDKKSRIESRAMRDSTFQEVVKDIEDIQREQRNTSNAVQLILQKLNKLDSIK